MPARRNTQPVTRTTNDGARFPFPVSLFTDHWDSLLIFFAAILLYTLTLSPDVLPADSGEFQVVVPLLGVAHPPGFSLYTLLGKLFISLIPQGTPAYRLNLFSALTSSLTLVLVNLAVNLLTTNFQPPTTNRQPPVSNLQSLVSKLPGLIAAFSLGVSTTFWSQATTTNIRSLMALLTALLIYALVEYRLTPTMNRLAFFAFTLSLAVVHHLSIAFIGLIFVLAALWFAPSPVLKMFFLQRRGPDDGGSPLPPGRAMGGEGRSLLKLLLAALLPLLILLYLPLRGAANAFLAPPGLTTLAGFFQHALATGFGGDFFYFTSLSDLPDRLSILVNIFLFQFNPALLILFALGLVLFFRLDRKLATAFTSAFAVHCFIAITYRAPQTVEYLLPAYVILVIAATGGLWQLSIVRDHWRLGFGIWDLRFLVYCSVFITSLFVALRNFPAYFTLALDHSTRDYAESALKAAPPNAVILAAWHYATPMWYLQQLESLRPDVTVEYVFPQGASLARNWVEAINANVATRPTLVTNLYPAEYAALPYRFTASTLNVPTIWQVYSEPMLGSTQDGYTAHEGGWIEYAGTAPTPLITTPGQTFPILQAWQAPETPTDINFFVQLIGPDGLLYGQSDLSRPARAMVPEEVIEGFYPITVNVNAGPGQYQLVTGAYLSDGTRLKPDWTKLADVTVIPRDTPPATAHPQPVGLVAGYDYDFSLAYAPRLYLHWRLDEQSHHLTLKDASGAVRQTLSLPASSGYLTTAIDLPPDFDWQTLTLTENNSSFTIQQSSFSAADRYASFGPIILTRAEVMRESDGSYRVDLDWLADRPLTDDLVIKIDLVGENYSWRTQSDSIPAGGAIPTLKWIPGIVIHDRHRLAPQAQTPAAFQLAVYDHFTLRDLPILDSRLAALGPTVPLGSIQP